MHPHLSSPRTLFLRAPLCGFLFLLFLAPAEEGLAAEYAFTSKTYVKFYEDPRDNKYAPLYERIELEGKGLHDGKLSLYLSGWVGYDFRTLSDGDRERDELTYAFLRYSPYQDGRLLVNLGRHYVFEGVASEQIDGVSARWEITQLAGLSLFGGVPVETEFDGRESDSAYGGRVYRRIPRKAEIGLSFLREENDKIRFREEIGADLWLRPVRRVEVRGQSSYNSITDGWREHSYTLRLFPLDRLTVSGLYSQASYDDAFFARTLSAFSPDFLGKGEKLTKTGGSAEYRLDRTTAAVLDFTAYDYELMGPAERYGGQVTASLAGISAGASFHRMDGHTERLRYIESRLYAVKGLGSWNFSLDTIFHHYDSPFSGLSNAYSVNGTTRYKITGRLTAGLSLDYYKTPDFIHATTVLLNLVYGIKLGR
jgi:hypothetical protein